mgnify:CR=1 FL=1
MGWEGVFVMAKIFEALELSGKALSGVKTDIVAPSPAREAPKLIEEKLHNLYLNILSMLPKERGIVVEFIGSLRGEGTSTLIREFAKFLAKRSNKKVLLLDADTHQPAQSRAFGITPRYGLKDVLEKGMELDHAVVQVANTNLYVSQIVLNPSPLTFFDTMQFDTILRGLMSGYDFILIDAPPAESSQDGMVLSRKVDGVVIIIEAERTRWQVAANLRDRILKQDGHILGVVLNKRRNIIPKMIYDKFS